MAKLPPQPLGVAPGSSYWNDWYEKLRTFVEQITSSVDWSIIINKPTTLLGYGITDGQTLLVNSAGLRAALNDETGNGLAVFNTSPTLVSPVLGVASASSLSVTSNTTPTNGLFLPAANTLGLATASSEQLRIGSTGNVSIGSGSAGAKLSLVGGTLPTADAGLQLSSALSAGRLSSGDTNNKTASITYWPDSSTVELSAGVSAGYTSGITASARSAAANSGTVSLYTYGTVRLQVNSVGQVILKTVGSGLSIPEGSNAKMGTATLVAGTAVVNNTSVTTNSRIFLTSQNTSGTSGAVNVSARVVGTSFTITSTSALDTSNVAWIIFEPS